MSEKDDITTQSKNEVSTGFIDSQKYLPQSPESEALTQQKEQEKEAIRRAKLAEFSEKARRAKIATTDSEDDERREQQALRQKAQEILRSHGIKEPKSWQPSSPPTQVPPSATSGTGCTLVFIGLFVIIAAVSLLPFFMKQLIALL